MHGRRDRADTEPDEFSLFVRHTSPALLRAAYLLTGDRHLAQDLVQTALARTHLAWRRLRDTGNAGAYARKTMYHLQVSAWRRRAVAETLSGDLPEHPGQPDHTSHTDLRLSLQQALLRLAPRQRAVLVLRYFEDRTEAETAELLDLAVGTVKSLTHHALGRLRQIAPELAPLATIEEGRR